MSRHIHSSAEFQKAFVVNRLPLLELEFPLNG
jgi:hypothetical protein